MEEIVVKKKTDRATQIQELIRDLDRKIIGYEEYHLTIPDIKRLELKRKELETEYRSLPPREVEVNLELKTLTTYTGQHFSIRKIKDRYFFYDNSNPLALNAKIILNDKQQPERIERTVIDSQTKGREVKLIYHVKILDEETQQEPKPSKNLLNQRVSVQQMNDAIQSKDADGEYFESLGFIKDQSTGLYRKPNPFEYDALQEQKKLKDNETKQSLPEVKGSPKKLFQRRAV